MLQLIEKLKIELEHRYHKDPLLTCRHATIICDYTSTDAEGEREFGHVTLTGIDHRLCAFAASIFNGYPTSLDEVLGAVSDLKMRLVLVETLRIRERMV